MGSMFRSAVCFLIGLAATLLQISGFTVATKPTTLFAFGDAYADTGNHDPAFANLREPWRPPYGSTWPTHPTGRFSDGKVFTDLVAQYLGISSPLPYRVIRKHSKTQIAAGISFAFGGSGVFPTYGPQFPNVSAQIQQLDTIIKAGLLSEELVAASLALIVLAGNDYEVFILQHPRDEGVKRFTRSVVREIVLGIRALYKLGIRRFAVTNLEPFGCLPTDTAPSNYVVCNSSQNARCAFHNKRLASSLMELGTKLADAQIVTLDLYSTFLSALGQSHEREMKARFPLRPCCENIRDLSCGDVDDRGRAMYKVCGEARQSFFWDMVHPSQAGWQVVYEALLPDLNTFISAMPYKP